MGFGGAASAANAAIKRNAALRGRRKNYFSRADRGSYGKAPGIRDTASDAVRKQFRVQLRQDLERDRRRLSVIVLVILGLLSGLIALL